MTPPHKRTQGFTLIELLVVIAIIGILAAFLAVGLPAALERAKIAKLENTFLQLRTILTAYYADHGTFPPAYGYLSPEARGFDPVELESLIESDIIPVEIAFFLKPWMAFLGEHNNLDLYDDFSETHDTDRDGDISRLEYAPPGVLEDPATQRFSFPFELYDPDSDLEDSTGVRPFLYFPVNKRQFRKVAAEWFKNDPEDPRPNDEKEVNGKLLEQRFPPPNYDAYVLISVGPTANTWKLIPDFRDALDDKVFNRLDQSNYESPYYYHVLGLAAYFMATRDAEDGGKGDGELDFDFRARTRRGQALNESNKLPDPNGHNAPGPMIFVGEG